MWVHCFVLLFFFGFSLRSTLPRQFPQFYTYFTAIKGLQTCPGVRKQQFVEHVDGGGQAGRPHTNHSGSFQRSRALQTNRCPQNSSKIDQNVLETKNHAMSRRPRDLFMTVQTHRDFIHNGVLVTQKERSRGAVMSFLCACLSTVSTSTSARKVQFRAKSARGQETKSHATSFLQGRGEGQRLLNVTSGFTLWLPKRINWPRERVRLVTCFYVATTKWSEFGATKADSIWI